MAENTSIFTQAIQDVVKRRNQMKDEMAKAKPVPFMEERVQLREARRQWEHMGPEQRREYIAKHGVDAALRLVKPPKTFSDVMGE